MSSIVPFEWTRVVAAHQYARIARDDIRNARTQQLRDDAVVRYGRALDEIMDSLTALDDRQVLTRITRLLKLEGRV